MAPQKDYCLRWNDFDSSLSCGLKDLRATQSFFDVKLVSDGGNRQISAHKVILAACSPFFTNVLERNPGPNTVLYLKGVRHRFLRAVVTFMYEGAVSVVQEDLQEFLEVCEDLEVKGLAETTPDGRTSRALPGNPANSSSEQEEEEDDEEGDKSNCEPEEEDTKQNEPLGRGARKRKRGRPYTPSLNPSLIKKTPPPPPKRRRKQTMKTLRPQPVDEQEMVQVEPDMELAQFDETMEDPLDAIAIPNSRGFFKSGKKKGRPYSTTPNPLSHRERVAKSREKYKDFVWGCPVSDCDRQGPQGVTRLETLRSHLINRHNMTVEDSKATADTASMFKAIPNNETPSGSGPLVLAPAVVAGVNLSSLLPLHPDLLQPEMVKEEEEELFQEEEEIEDGADFLAINIDKEEAEDFEDGVTHGDGEEEDFLAGEIEGE